MSLTDFFQKYFIQPINLGTGYNPINTFAYALLFVVVTYLVYEFLKKLKIKPDQAFVLAIIPWVIFGIFLRVMEDSGLIKSKLFVTPNIWLLFTFLIALGLFFSKFIEKKYKIPYFKFIFISGLMGVGILIPFLKIRNFEGFLYTFLWFIPWLILSRVIRWSKENKFVTSAQLFDATATFVSLQYFGYFEQHVLPRFIIELTGIPFSFVIVKLIVVVVILKTLDKYSDDKEFASYLKIVIGLLGFITGFRDLLRLVMFV